MNIGKYKFNRPVMLSPMAGITDLPFRNLCFQLGADLCVSEMVTSEKHLWKSRKTQLRLNHTNEKGICSVQIAGTEPIKLADAARFNVRHGAQIIDLNMGCPAKKVCNVLAGSALLKNEALVANIVSTVVNAVNVPVTLKIRTGWDQYNKNAVNIAKIAEQNGIQALIVHGRTRADAYKGEAEYETIAKVKAAVSVIASVARQSHAMESMTWRLPRHFVPRNDELIRVSLIFITTHNARKAIPESDLSVYLDLRDSPNSYALHS